MFKLRILLNFAIAVGLYPGTAMGYAPISISAHKDPVYFYPGKADIKYDHPPGILWEQVHLSIFDELQPYAKQISEESTFFQDVAVDALGTAVGAIPGVGPVLALFMSTMSKLGNKEQWKNDFAKTILKEADQNEALNEVIRLKALIEAIHKSLTNGGTRFSNVVSWDTRKDLEYIMNIFGAHNSVFKRYPLIGAHILTGLSALISTFDKKINNPDVACKMRNILLDYRKRAIEERLDKISFEYAPLPEK